MIKYFTVENFKSIKHENVLEFDAKVDKDLGYAAHPVIGFAGANASGKTNILQALAFVLWFMQRSFLEIAEGKDIPVEPFRTLQQTPTIFHIIFSQRSYINAEDKLIDYEYRLSLTKERVLREELFYYPYGRKRLAYLRDETNVKFGDSVNDIPTKDLRSNSSLISFAAQFASQEVAKACKTYNFYSNLSYKGFKEDTFHPDLLRNLLKDEENRHRIQEFLKIADVGIEDVYLKEAIFPLKETTIIANLLQTLEKLANGEEKQAILKMSEAVEAFSKLEGFSDNIMLKGAFFKHKIDNQFVDFYTDLESTGTLKFLAILYRVLAALGHGSLLILDEIEIKLHQNLVAYLIGLFENKSENPNGAQLIFSFHNTSFMEILRPEQLWFTEKNDQGYTEIFCAADFKDIPQLHKKNLEELYRIGRFGAKPRGL